MMINGNNNSGALSDDASSGGGGGGGAGSGGGALKKGPWTAAEDAILREYVKKHGEGNWNAVQKNSGLSRCGKSCRLRWANHLRPNLKKGSFTPDEERIILELHAKLGNKWARMAAQLPGRTDNEIKNYWNTRVKRRQRQGLPLYPHDIQKQPSSFNHHQPFLSQSSMKPTNLSSISSSQEQKLNFGSLLPPFNPMNISNTTPSFPPHQNNTHFSSSSINSLKRFRPNSCGLYQPFSPYISQTLPHSSSILNQSLLPPPQPIQFHLGNYDPNQSQHILQNQYEHRNMVPMSSSPSIKMELPSNQLPQSDGITSRQDVHYKINGTFTRSNGGGYLDDILQEAQQARDDDEELRRKGLFTQQEQCRVDGIEREAPETRKIFNESNDTARLESAGHWNDSRTTHSTIGVKRKEAGDNQNDSVVQEDDLSRLLDSIPSTMLVSEFYNDGGDQISNGQSSGVTDDETGLDMQHHLPSSLSTTTTTATNTNTTTTSGGSTIPQHDWNVMGTGWNDLPEMC